MIIHNDSSIQIVEMVSFLSLIACGTATYIIQRYEGPPLPREQVAILRIVGDQQVPIVALDDESLGAPISDRNTRLHIELLPGMHQVTVTNPVQLGRMQTLRFEAEAGKFYRVLLGQALVRAATTLVPRVYEMGREGDDPVRDVTIIPSPAMARPPAPDPTPAEVEPAAKPPDQQGQPEAPTDAGVRPPLTPESGDAGLSDTAAPGLADAAVPELSSDAGAP